MNDFDFTQELALSLARDRLSEARFAHSERVAELAVKLGQLYNVDLEDCYIAGMLHDIAKEMPIDEQRALVSVEYGEQDFFFLPQLLHGPAACALLVRAGYRNEEVLRAIYYHSMAGVGLSPLAEIIYLADLLEEGRDFPKIDFLRECLEISLPYAMFETLKEVINYLERTDKKVYPSAIEAVNYYEKKINKGE